MSKEQAFQRLRPPCVDLSSVALKYRSHQTNSQAVQRCLENLHTTLQELGHIDSLNVKLAEYAFYPLRLVLNETKTLSVRCVELAVKCLHVLVAKGWRQKLGPEMGKQLLILLTILAGGSPSRGAAEKRSEELSLVSLQCIQSVLDSLETKDNTTLFHEPGSVAIVDQAVFVFLEEITDGVTEDIQLAALEALKQLTSSISDRQILASFFPRTVSSLTRTLTPSSQARRTQKVLKKSLLLLTKVIQTVLNDTDAIEKIQSVKSKGKHDDSTVLDDAWLKATASQVRLALANVVRLKNHARAEVRQALLKLCLMVIEKCKRSLSESQSMSVETIVALSDSQEDPSNDEAFLVLTQLVRSDASIADILRSSLHDWAVALPRVMQSNDDAVKQRGLRQIATAFDALSKADVNIEILDEDIATTLHDSLSAAIRTSNSPSSADLYQPPSTSLEVLSLNDDEDARAFHPVLMGNRSQTQTWSELSAIVRRLKNSESSLTLTKVMIKKLYNCSGNDLLAAFWFTLNFLKNDPTGLRIDDFLHFGPTSLSRPEFIEELYSIALPIITDLPDANPSDWRLPALALEAIVLQAQQLKADFRSELIDALYPILQLVDSNNPFLRSHAMTALNLVSKACDYSSTSDMVITNVDYLVNSIALKLNVFDISPQAPQVLLMMIKLCGAQLIPYLDDLVGSIFAALVCFHGYPRLVELLFSVLGAIVEEATKASSAKAITEGPGPSVELPTISLRKRPPQPFSVQDLSAELRSLKPLPSTDDYLSDDIKHTHPNRPFSSSLDGPRPPASSGSTTSDITTEPDEDSPLPTQKHDNDKEAPLTPTSTLLLSILQSVPPHLSSPSPALRKHLLTLLSTSLTASYPIDIITTENHLLPLINTLWPTVSPRLYDPEVYVAVASASAMAGMMQRAGDFMASRVEHELPAWRKLHARVWKSVNEQRQRRRKRELEFRAKHHHHHHHHHHQQPIVLAQVDSPPHTTTVTPESLQRHTFNSRDPDSQLHAALTLLFCSILSHVRLRPEEGDQIVDMLALGGGGGGGAAGVGVTGNTEVEEAIAAYNDDLLWLVLRREREREIQQST